MATPFILRYIIQTPLQIPLALAPLLLILASPAPAASEGFYAGLSAGIGQTSDADINGTGINSSAEFDSGGVALLTMGYAYANGLRGELELGSRWSDADSISNTTASGDVRSISAMVNAYYDISTGGAFSPYIGLGLGGAQIKANSLSPISTSSINDTDTALAYQGIVGMSYQLSQNVALNADYRYFATRDLDFTTAGNTNVSQQYGNHALMFGISFSFGSQAKNETKGQTSVAATPAMVSPAIEPTVQPTPEPQPETLMAAVATTQSSIAPAMPTYPTAYRLLFDWNSAALNTQAMEVIQLTAHNALKINDGKVIRIVVNGHADRSGTMRNNLKLSIIRAETVRDALVKKGVSNLWIATEGFGEGQPVLETKDGVRALQNRRVEIIFKP